MTHSFQVLSNRGLERFGRLPRLLLETVLHVLEILLAPLGVDIVVELFEVGVADVDGFELHAQADRQVERPAHRFLGVGLPVHGQQDAALLATTHPRLSATPFQAAGQR